MKKVLLLGGALLLLSSTAASAQIDLQFGDDYPHGNEWNRHYNRDYYWQQVRINEEAEEHARQEAPMREANDYPDNGHRYAYSKGHQKQRGNHRNDNH